MSVKGWVRVSGNKQDEQHQRHEILEYCNANHLFIEETDWFSYTVSTRKTILQEYLAAMLATMQHSDTLIVTELSRLGREPRDVYNLIFNLNERGVALICIKENLKITSEKSISNTAMIGAFTLANALERALLSQRTKDAQAAVKARGVKLGRKPGKAGKTKLDEFEKVITELAVKGVSVTSIAKIIDAKRSTVDYFVRTRNLKRRGKENE